MNPKHILILATLICAAGLQGASTALASGETDVQRLEELSVEFTAQLEARRTPLYFRLLSAPSPAQQQLNLDPTIQLMYIDGRGRPVFFATDNLTSAATISTDRVWPGGSGGFSLNGSGTALGRLGIWDGGGVRVTHREFDGRATQMDSPSGTSFHATHVAGTLVAGGVSPDAHGMSPQAELAAYDWSSDESEMAAAAAAGMNVSNHSYGTATGWRASGGDWYWYGDPGVSEVEDYKFGFYDGQAEAWDEIAYNAPFYTITKSAGNDRNDNGPGPGGLHFVWENDDWVEDTTTRDRDGGLDGFDCISTKGVAKNIITVGAVADIPLGYQQPSNVLMSAFSGWGPTDDGRIKPDIVANGIGLFSADDDNDADYTTLNGTSMSSPSAAGSMNLLVEHYESTHDGSTPRAATIKSLVIHTADEAGPAPGPDYMFGWGLINTLRGADLIQADSGGSGYIVEDLLSDGEQLLYAFTSDGSEPLRVVLVWTDPPANALTPSVDPTTPVLVHDLDLRVYEGTLSTHQPWILDPTDPSLDATTGDNSLDNVEQVHVESPGAGHYLVAVDHKGSLSAQQNFSLVSSHPLTAYQCPLSVPGDVNADALTNSADIIYLVGYVFKGDAAPVPCEAAGDADCNGLVTSADIIDMVNFVFKSGSPPCDVCSVIPGAWTCP